MKFLRDIWSLRSAYGPALDLLVLLAIVSFAVTNELKSHPLEVALIVLIAPFYLIVTLKNLLHDISATNPPKDKMTPELEHPELEYRPWGDPDTWVPPDRPKQ